MLGRLHLASRSGVRRLGPLLVSLVALTVVGLGAHAALDWHRHGGSGVGFVHLHVHFGQHHHGDHHDHEHESPRPDAPSDDRRECGTLVLALGVAPAPAVASAERPALEANERVLGGGRQPTDRQPVDLSWSPRGPPA